MSKSIAEQQKLYVNHIDMDSWTESRLAQTVNPDQTNVLRQLFGAGSSTPLGTDMFRVSQMLPEDIYHRPSLASCPCDPALPLQTQSVEQMKITDIKPPYIKRFFEVIDCDENLDRASLRELGRVFNNNELSNPEKTNIQVSFKQRALEGEIVEAIGQWFDQSLFWGKTHVRGKGLPKSQTTFDFGRDEDLFTCLPGQGWANKKAPIREVFRIGQRRIYDCSKNYCNTTDVILSPEAEVLALASMEMSECSPCGTISNHVTDSWSFDRTPVGNLPKGIRPFPFTDGFSNARYWVLDERKLMPEYDPVTGKETGKLTLQNAMPAGAIMFINRNDIAPIRLQGKIKNLRYNVGSMDRYARTYWSQGDECYTYKVDSSPFEFIQRTNCVHMMWIDPINCPPPCWVSPKKLECDPEGGKKAALAAKSVGGDVDVQAQNKAAEDLANALKAINELTERLETQEQENAEVKQTILAQSSNKKGNK